MVCILMSSQSLMCWGGAVEGNCIMGDSQLAWCKKVGCGWTRWFTGMTGRAYGTSLCGSVLFSLLLGCPEWAVHDPLPGYFFFVAYWKWAEIELKETSPLIVDVTYCFPGTRKWLRPSLKIMLPDMNWRIVKMLLVTVITQNIINFCVCVILIIDKVDHLKCIFFHWCY